MFSRMCLFGMYLSGRSDMITVAVRRASVFIAINSIAAAVPGMLTGNQNLSAYHLGRSLQLKYPHIVKTSLGCLMNAP